jgi:hypothetical protein
MNTTTTSAARGAWACLLLVLSACAQGGGDDDVTARRGDDAEGVATGAELRDGWTREGTWLLGRPLTTTPGEERVGALAVLTAEGPPPRIEVRAGEGEPWVPLRVTWSEVDHHVAAQSLTPGARRPQLRVHADDAASCATRSRTRPSPSLPAPA